MKERYKFGYFIGIGGIGMSAIARYLHSQGVIVSGYDRMETRLTKELEEEGIVIHYDESAEHIPEDRESTLVIYTPAIPESSIELNYVKDSGYNIFKRSAVLGEITNSNHLVAVAGTHGKTSISTMASHILYASGEGCNAFLGGIAQNYSSNLLLTKSSSRIVVEADEFDRSFLQLTPNVALISSTDADHLDIYGDHSHVVEGFAAFIGRVKDGGVVITKDGCDIDSSSISNLKPNLTHYNYSLSDSKSDFYAENLRKESGVYHYNIVTPMGVIDSVVLQYPGLINVENSIAAAAIATIEGVSFDKIRSTLETYRGVRRRFDIRYRDSNVIYIDDYAHHPTEIKATLNSVRELYEGEKITVLFQPHLYTRTRDFQDGFAESLSIADRAILLDIYPAREEPIPGVTSLIITDKMHSQDVDIKSREDALQEIAAVKSGVILTLGAGDIDKLTPQIVDLLSNRDRK